METNYVNIGIVSGAHGSHVAGIASGNKLFGGAMSGQAPGAKILSSRACLFNTGCTSHALTEGMIQIVRDGADIVNMSIGGLPALNDGNNTRCEVYNRLINKKGVQIVLSNGNSGPGLNTAGDPAVCADAVGMGAYLSRASMRSNYGADTPFDDNLNYFSSVGPAEDGGFKPEAIAPGSAVSTTPEWQAGGPVPGTYTLPPGYSMFNGTSMASPQGAGAGALLLSAAKAMGFARSRTSSARRCSRPRATSIRLASRRPPGNGLLNVPAAWDVLKTKPETVDFTATVPVNTVLSGFLQTPGVGTGIYDREGVTVGSPYTRTYTITRTNGGSNPRTFNLNWVGNDGTFSHAGVDHPGEERRDAARRQHQPVCAGAALGDPQLRRSGEPGRRVPDDEHGCRSVCVQRGEQLLERDHQHSRTRTAAALLLPCPGRHAGVQGRSGHVGVDDAGTGQIRFLRWHPYGARDRRRMRSPSATSPAAGSCCACR